MSKSYPGVLACDEIGFEVLPGEIHSLLGENGAGKSTLVKMIYGLVRPDGGSMWIDGASHAPPNPRAARDTGVALVFQHFSLFEALSVAENISLSIEHSKPSELSDRIRDVSKAYGLELEPDKLVGDLSAGERQRVEIVRCLLQYPKLLIMDEPTSVLTPQEVDELFQTLRTLVSEGTAILYISHKLEEIRTLCDRATILRNGQVVATCDPKEHSSASLAEMMVGTNVVPPSRSNAACKTVLMAVSNLSLASESQFGTNLESVSLELAAGEILGIAGIAGNGQNELLAALSGEIRPANGTITVSGKEVQSFGPNRRRMMGLLAAPEQRLGHAASPDMSLTENALLSASQRLGLTPGGIIDWASTATFAKSIVETFDVRTAGVEHAAKSLSGGNLQKFLVGREILQDPLVLVINQPTWGVDASAASAIRQSLIDLADKGTGILAISQDLDELLEITDRIAVLRDGKLSAPLLTATARRTDLGLLMLGA